jgi:hypothetical protein
MSITYSQSSEKKFNNALYYQNICDESIPLTCFYETIENKFFFIRVERSIYSYVYECMIL